MGQCLRGKMTDAGLIPAPATAVAAPEAEPAEEVAVVTPEPATSAADPATDVAAPALDVTPPAAEVPENLIAATFGLLRAEPDGSVVIAGSGTPGTEVEVYSNGSLLGKATVETTGDWVLVPDAPLPAGGVEITLGEAGKTGRAAESFVVAIADDKTSQPLVVASTPGAASEVLQGLQPPTAGTSTEVASAEPATPPVAADPAAPAEPAETPAAPDVAPTTTPPVEVAPVAEPAPVAADPASADQPAVATTETSASPAEPARTPPAEPASADTPAEPVVATAEAAPVEPSTAAAADATVAAVATQVTPTVVLEGTPPTIDAIELESEETFFAGGGPEGATMRLYVDDIFIADAKVEGGRWLVEAGKVLTKPSQRVRIDMLQPDSAKVASRAEVNFVIELPVEEAPIAVAQAEPTDQPEPATPAPEPAAVEPAAPAPEPAVAAPAPTPEAPAAESATTEPAASATTPAEPAPTSDKAAEPALPESEPIVVASGDKAIEPAAAALDATIKPDQASVAAATPEPTTPAEPVVTAEATPPADDTADEPAPTPATEPAPVADVPTMVAVAIGGADAQRFVSGKAIIRRGDNLWTIARRTYGEGIKYTTIYQANTGQIRDPDRIYPGQVFDLPEGAN
ncbi:LysM peptidoglycan-binding domain-containing protein [Devosia sp. SL43]|uniref:LysM peptidoglycan-binding domain-containing protein n=1 Tax=Devosia sp. SL43 TaxID=2806348 RepID=UPI002351A766|nr:LysM peptidoglycan-binding domain-containing protein [Devosia sp. SL43]UJW85608.1 LysM peptidoglycan-binding domain-containing protein [Devosia sp. SL43]